MATPSPELERLDVMLGPDAGFTTMLWLWKEHPSPPDFDEVVDTLGRFGFDAADIRARVPDPMSRLDDREWRRVYARPKQLAFGWFAARFNPDLVPYLEASVGSEVEPNVAARSAVFAEHAGVAVEYYVQALDYLTLDEILLHWPLGTPIEYVLAFRD